MADQQNPKEQRKSTKRSKKLELNKETVQELSDQQLEGVAGGVLGTNGGHCLEQTYMPACPSGNLYCIAPTKIFGCSYACP